MKNILGNDLIQPFSNGLIQPLSIGLIHNSGNLHSNELVSLPSVLYYHILKRSFVCTVRVLFCNMVHGTPVVLLQSTVHNTSGNNVDSLILNRNSSTSTRPWYSIVSLMSSSCTGSKNFEGLKSAYSNPYSFGYLPDETRGCSR